MNLRSPARFESWLRDILAIAKVARQRPGDWDAVRRAWTPGVQRPSSYVGDAAHPVEVHEVLLAVQAACRPQLPDEPLDPEDEAMSDFCRHRIDDFVRAETEAYIEQVTPKSNIGGIFAAAFAAQGRPSPGPAGSGPAAAVRTCGTCGAPRQSESIYGNCPFCGAPLFPKST